MDLLERLRGWPDITRGQRLLGLPDRLKEDLWDAAVEIERLRRRIEDAEIALRTWDGGRNSEYWLRHAVGPTGSD